MASDDEDLFKKETRGVRPLAQDRREPHRTRRQPIPQQRRNEDQETLQNLLSDGPDDTGLETGDELFFRRNGVQITVMRKLKRGSYAVEGELDLHGRTVNEARDLVARFVHERTALGKRCVRIIHGKGRSSPGKLPVLKNKVDRWLAQMDAVLAYTSARREDGGTGVVLVLLRAK